MRTKEGKSAGVQGWTSRGMFVVVVVLAGWLTSGDSEWALWVYRRLEGQDAPPELLRHSAIAVN